MFVAYLILSDNFPAHVILIARANDRFEVSNQLVLVKNPTHLDQVLIGSPNLTLQFVLFSVSWSIDIDEMNQ